MDAGVHLSASLQRRSFPNIAAAADVAADHQISAVYSGFTVKFEDYFIKNAIRRAMPARSTDFYWGHTHRPQENRRQSSFAVGVYPQIAGPGVVRWATDFSESLLMSKVTSKIVGPQLNSKYEITVPAIAPFTPHRGIR
jgi:hypothetical protein